jgi:hypothetical protein
VAWAEADAGSVSLPGEGQDEGSKEWVSSLDSLTLALSRREREFPLPNAPIHAEYYWRLRHERCPRDLYKRT